MLSVLIGVLIIVVVGAICSCGGRMKIIETFDGPLSRPYRVRRLDAWAAGHWHLGQCRLRQEL